MEVPSNKKKGRNNKSKKLTESTVLSNGMTLDLYVAIEKLRIYTSVYFCTSLFFLVWSSLAIFIYTNKNLACYGILCFSISIVISLSLMLNRALHTGNAAKISTLAACIACSAYFGLLTYGLYKIDYGMSWMAITVLFCIFYLILGFLGFTYLEQVQNRFKVRITDKGLVLSKNRVITVNDSDQKSDDGSDSENDLETNEEETSSDQPVVAKRVLIKRGTESTMRDDSSSDSSSDDDFTSKRAIRRSSIKSSASMKKAPSVTRRRGSKIIITMENDLSSGDSFTSKRALKRSSIKSSVSKKSSSMARRNNPSSDDDSSEDSDISRHSIKSSVRKSKSVKVLEHAMKEIQLALNNLPSDDDDYTSQRSIKSKSNSIRKSASRKRLEQAMSDFSSDDDYEKRAVRRSSIKTSDSMKKAPSVAKRRGSLTEAVDDNDSSSDETVRLEYPATSKRAITLERNISVKSNSMTKPNSVRQTELIMENDDTPQDFGLEIVDSKPVAKPVKKTIVVSKSTRKIKSDEEYRSEQTCLLPAMVIDPCAETFNSKNYIDSYDQEALRLLADNDVDFSYSSPLVYSNDVVTPLMNNDNSIDNKIIALQRSQSALAFDQMFSSNDIAQEEYKTKRKSSLNLLSSSKMFQ